jgi:aryl-alcohol dehydrogenase-like predicted oxidoreductase
MGLVVWSPLAGGILTGKYASGVPAESRGRTAAQFVREEQIARTAPQVRRLVEIAGSLGCTPAQLAIAWILRRPQVSSVILGATSVGQLMENLGAADVKAPDAVDAELSRIFPVD